MQNYAIIPARYSSTRLPGKPLVTIGGKPMIQHVYERTALCPRLCKVVVATDDTRIMTAVESFGGNCVLTRADHRSGTDRLNEAAELLGLADDDLVINVQGDEPFVEPSMIGMLIEAATESDSEMATLAFPSEDMDEFLDPNCVKVVMDGSKKALYFSRAPIPFSRDVQRGKQTFLKHLGFYAYRRWFLRQITALAAGELETAERLEQLRALENGYSIRVALSPVDSLSVDTPADLEKVRVISEKRR
ncbi:MAG: 3-deoxy-manno-octulosonate cytidylyltransferase [Syntrophobacter sp.]